MKIILFVILISKFLQIHSKIIVQESNLENLMFLKSEFNDWLLFNRKTYHSLEEYNHRLNVFIQNKVRIDKHNAINHSSKQELNVFSDLTSEEYMAKFIPFERIGRIEKKESFFGFIYSWFGLEVPYQLERKPEVAREEPDYTKLTKQKIDWDQNGYLSTVRDQMECGGCYAFGAVAASEAAYKIKYGKDIEFSEQFIIDCGKASRFRIYGCKGAMPDQPQKFLVKEGLVLRSDNKYLAVEGTCKNSLPRVAKVVDVKEDFTNIYELLKEVIEGPVAIAIQWIPELQHHRNGVLAATYPCGYVPNHIVTAVGFDLTASEPYIKIRNSHGVRWGEEGNVRFLLTQAGDAGYCGLGMVGGFRPIVEAI